MGTTLIFLKFAGAFRWLSGWGQGSTLLIFDQCLLQSLSRYIKLCWLQG